LPRIPGADIRLVHGAVEPVHAEMRATAGGRNIWLVGGGDLVGQFYDAGLLDEVHVSIAPVTLVAGAPLLPRRIEGMRLVSAEPDAQRVNLVYEVPASRGSTAGTVS
jgi:dihydrofolate reductase